MSDTLRRKEVFYGGYRGISFEIQNFSIDSGEFKNCWTFYLYIVLDQLPEELRKRFWLRKKKTGIGKTTTYDYYKEPLISNIDFHGGCTWYSKESGFDGDSKMVKIGCDFQHLWDQGKNYSVTYVQREVEQAIDSLHTLIPNMKFRCSWSGEYFYKEEMVEVDGYKGSISKKGKQQREESMNEALKR